MVLAGGLVSAGTTLVTPDLDLDLTGGLEFGRLSFS